MKFKKIKAWYEEDEWDDAELASIYGGDIYRYDEPISNMYIWKDTRLESIFDEIVTNEEDNLKNSSKNHVKEIVKKYTNTYSEELINNLCDLYNIGG